MEALLGHASLLLVFALLVAAGLGLPMPEDVVLLSTGAMAHRGIVPLPLALATCMGGVLAGDLLLFTTAKRLGKGALERPAFRRLLTPERRQRVDALLQKHGGKVIFAARHLAGLRAPTFALAGINGMATARFLAWDALGLCLSAPLMFGLGYFSSAHIDRVRAGIARTEHWLLFAVAVALLVYAGWVFARRHLVRA